MRRRFARSAEVTGRRDLTDERISHLSHTIAPLLRFSFAGTYPELQFRNQTEQLALAYLRTDCEKIEQLRERITEHLSLLPANIPEALPHLAPLAAA